MSSVKMNENRSKVCRRVRVVTRKWTIEEEQEILNYIKRYLDHLQQQDNGQVRANNGNLHNMRTPFRSDRFKCDRFNSSENFGMPFLREDVVSGEIRCHIGESNAKQSEKSATKVFESG